MRILSCWWMMIFLFVGAAGAENRTGFRGLELAGTFRDIGIFEDIGQPGIAVPWKRRIGSGYSGVAVAAGTAVTMYADGDVDVAAAFATADGRTLWRYEIAATYKGHDGSHNGPISTPLVAGERVFGLGPWGQLFALDLATGEELWSTHLAEDHGVARPMYGFGTSPLLQDGVLIVELGGEGRAVGGFDPETGARKWLAGSDGVSYQSPVPATLAGRRQVVAAGDTLLFGLDAASGEVLWQWPHGGAGARGAMSLVPLPLPGDRLFLAHHHDASMVVELRPGSAETVDKVWEGCEIRNSFNVPVYRDGYLYAYSSRFLTCVDAATGEARWRSRKPGDGFLVLVDGRLVIVTRKGAVLLVEATPEAYRELASRQVFDDLVWTPPSFAGGAVYARGLGEIARIDVTAGGGRREAAARVASRPPADSVFGRFLAEVEAADDRDKPGLVDRFLAAQESFPIVEASGWVHFVYSGPATDMALAGEMFGARIEQPMTRAPGTDLFYYSLALEPDARLTYHFIRDFQEIVDPRNPRREPRSYFRRDMEITFYGDGVPMSWFAMPGWRRPAHLEPAPAAARGRVETHELTSAALAERVKLHVYLPAGYDAGTRRHPVAYVHAGRIALEDGRVPNSLDNLIGASVEPLIAVFIDAPEPHHLAVLPWLDGYERALLEEIVPFVDERYRTETSARSRANVGAGLSAFIALAVTLDHRNLFGAVASQSLVLPDEFRPTLEPLFDSAADPPVVYMDWGTYDLRAVDEPVDMVRLHREMVAELRASGLAIAGGEAHDGVGWSSWRNRTDRVFETLFPLRRERTPG